MWSPDGAGFDDRAGILVILELLKLGYRPHLLFTNYEEVGGLGANKFIEDYPTFPVEDCKVFIEIDRQGEEEAVFYQCDCKKWQDFVSSFGFYQMQGTFSDISILMSAYNMCGVNVSAGYWYEHTQCEMLKMDSLEKTVKDLNHLLTRVKIWGADLLNFEYSEKPRLYSSIFPINKNGNCILCGSKLTDINTDYSVYYHYNKNYYYCCKNCSKKEYV